MKLRVPDRANHGARDSTLIHLEIQAATESSAPHDADVSWRARFVTLAAHAFCPRHTLDFHERFA
jgi:hypothetical protein